MRIPSFLVLVAIGALGCSGDPAASPSGTSTAASTSPSGCPLAAPAEGSACPKVAVGCSYGDSPTADCRDEVVCGAGGWSKRPSECNGTPEACAAGVADGAECAASKGAACLGDGGRLCVCSACEGSAGAMCTEQPQTWLWTCKGAPPAPCPAEVPNDGTACAADGAECSYGYPCHGGRGVIAVCMSGAWVWQAKACPG